MSLCSVSTLGKEVLAMQDDKEFNDTSKLKHVAGKKI